MIGSIKCAYCDFVANHPIQMDNHREDVHEDEIEKIKDREIERSIIRRHKENNNQVF